MTKLAAILLLAASVVGCEKNGPSKLDDIAKKAPLPKDDAEPKAFKIDSAAAASANHEGSVEERLVRLENELAQNREAMEFLNKVYAQQKAQMEQQEASEPAPDAVFAVPVAGDVKAGMVDGPNTALVTVVKAFDFACPYCQQTSETMEQLVADYKGKVRVVYKNLVVHPDTAMTGHLASCAAAKQGKYLPFKKAFWEKSFMPYAQSRGAEKDKMAKDFVLTYSKDLGLDTTKMAADMDSEDCKKVISQDMSELEVFRVNSTPTFFVNGRMHAGALSLPAFKQLIDAEIATAEKAGVKGDYYEQVVIAKGEKQFRSKKDPKPQ